MITCKQCGRGFERIVPPELANLPMIRLCQECFATNAAARRFETEQRKAELRLIVWLQLCPPAFQDTTLARLPVQAKTEEVLKWEYQSRGLILVGKTRRGKTRTAWLLLRKLVAEGRSVRVMDSMSGIEYAGIFSEGGKMALEWVRSRNNVAVLFLDDVFKVKLTDSFEAALFAIIDHRMSHKLPIIATVNDTGKTLATRMTDDRGLALISRLREMCVAIQF